MDTAEVLLTTLSVTTLVIMLAFPIVITAYVTGLVLRTIRRALPTKIQIKKK